MQEVKKYGPILIILSVLIVLIYLSIALISQKIPMNQIPGIDWAIATSVFLALLAFAVTWNTKLQLSNKEDQKDHKEELSEEFRQVRSGQKHLQESFDSKINKRTEKDTQQDNAINKNATDIEILKIRLTAVEDNMKALKEYIRTEMGDLRVFIADIIKNKK